MMTATIRSPRARRRRVGPGAIVPLAFLLPALAVLAMFRLWPMIESFRISLTDSKGYGPATNVGWDNYAKLVHDDKFRTALVNSLIVVAMVPLAVMIPLALAMFLREKPWGWRVFRLTLFLPAVLSPVILGSFFELMLRFDGPLNKGLRAIGLKSLTREWLTDIDTALPVVIAIIIWGGLGVGVLIFLSAMATIDQTLYDAALIDGANWWQQQRAVTFPQIKPTIGFYSVLTVIASFTATFPYVYVLTKGAPGYRTYVAEYAVYQSAFNDGAFGYGAAQGVVLFLIVLLVVILTMRLTAERDR